MSGRVTLTPTQIKVLVVGGTAESRPALVNLLASDAGIRVLGAVEDEASAINFLSKEMPDLILMDNETLRMDGFEITRRIMETQPLPVVICTPAASDTVFRALEAGALACIEKPLPGDYPGRDSQIANLLTTVRLMAEVRVVRRWSRQAVRAPFLAPKDSNRLNVHPGSKLVGIGASTGGPLVLQTILASLPRDFSIPVLVVQHIAKGFLPGMAEWLQKTSGPQIQIATYGVVPLPGHVYLAPDDFHMGIGAAGHIVLSRLPSTGLRPSVACLFHSLLTFCGDGAIGVLLTGMGKDGAAELKLLRDGGAVTIAQDRETSVVHGMPGEAISLNAATHVLPAGGIAAALLTLAGQNNISE